MELRVEATSTGQGDAVLSVEGYGPMTWDAGDGKYEYKVKGSADPDGWVTVTSSLGGETTSSVIYKDVLDGIVIKAAAYKSGDRELRVEAYVVGQPDTVLTVEGYGQMYWDAEKVRYKYKIKPVADPGTVTITASTGDSVTATVTYE
jgi:hypothetical protein